jgi:ABC-type glutathione transport system ATPase component
MAVLEIRNLHVSHEETGKEIVKGVDLAVDLDQVHAVMGPNGSGKSTLAYALMGHPAYEITEGEILFDGENLVELGADERALPRLPVPACSARRHRHEFPALFDQRAPQGACRPGRSDPDPGVS